MHSDRVVSAGTKATVTALPDDPAVLPARLGAVSGLLTIAEVAAYLNVPQSWVRDKVTARQVPFTRLGKHVRFTAEHVTYLIAAGEQPPLPAVTRHRRARRRSA